MVEAATGMAKPKPHVSTWPQGPTQCSLPKTGRRRRKTGREERERSLIIIVTRGNMVS